MANYYQTDLIILKLSQLLKWVQPLGIEQCQNPPVWAPGSCGAVTALTTRHPLETPSPASSHRPLLSGDVWGEGWHSTIYGNILPASALLYYTASNHTALYSVALYFNTEQLSSVHCCILQASAPGTLTLAASGQFYTISLRCIWGWRFLYMARISESGGDFKIVQYFLNVQHLRGTRMVFV